MTRDVLLADIGNRIAARKVDHPLRVAIDGVDGAGKTVFADLLARAIQTQVRCVIRASLDGFHNPARVRYQRGPLSPAGYYRDSFNYEKVIAWLLQPLGPGGNRVYRSAAFDYRADLPAPSEPEQAPANAVLLMDGVFLLRPELLSFWDFSIFLRVDFSTAQVRLLAREGTRPAVRGDMQKRWRQRYLPGQYLYFRDAAPERQASLVVDNSDWENPFFVSDVETGGPP